MNDDTSEIVNLMIIVKIHCPKFKCLENYKNVTLEQKQSHVGVARGEVCDVYQNWEKGKYINGTNK